MYLDNVNVCFIVSPIHFFNKIGTLHIVAFKIEA